jgi:fatty-acyl-CoA synthase
MTAEFTFTPLTPVSFLERAALAFPERTAVIDGPLSWTYAEFDSRCRRVAAALASSGVMPGDRVAALCSNSHTMLELHFAVPMCGAVLVSLNVRLSVDELTYIVRHCSAGLMVATAEFAETAAGLAAGQGIDLLVSGGPSDTYEAWLGGDVADPDIGDVDERGLVAVNYTSGTTGRPKGVMYHHRGAYLQSVAMAYHAGLSPGSRYLWTLPMFHCNGWCFTWAVVAAGATHHCLRRVDSAEIWRLLRDEGVTHFSAAPTVLTMIANDPSGQPLDRRVHVDTGGAAPSPQLFERLRSLGLDVTHLYGLTETFGPIAVNVWQPEWDGLAPDAAAALRARQGVSNVVARPLRVLDQDGQDVPGDSQTIGQIALRGNDLMLGYYRDKDATDAATLAGCFLTGDLGVMHPDGYIELRDRIKDIIISGGENIASLEVERAIDAHPAVVESGVVGVPDPLWGEVPVAFVTLGEPLEPDELVMFLKARLAGYKIPRRIIFSDLPKTSTGKIQKSVLRDRARDQNQRGRRTREALIVDREDAEPTEGNSARE